MRGRLSFLLIFCMVILLFCGCSKKQDEEKIETEQTPSQGLISGIPVEEMDYGGKEIGVYAEKLLMGQPCVATQ